MTTKSINAAVDLQKEIAALRRYIQECPTVSKDSRAIQAALDGLDQEHNRTERDLKLMRKFSGVQSGEAATSVANTSTTPTKRSRDLESSYEEVDTEEEFTKVTPRDLPPSPYGAAATSSEDADEQMEWQDVAAAAITASSTNGGSHNNNNNNDPIDQENGNGSNNNNNNSDDNMATDIGQGSVLGTLLAQSAVQAIADRGTVVSSPLAAVMLALHAALLSPTLSFACTGVPEKAPVKGFAAPIRELPKSRFVPDKWEDGLTIRYRKTDVGSVVLSVATDTTDMDDDGPGKKAGVVVKLVRSNQQASSPQLTISSIDRHINLESFQRAMDKQHGRVVPTLHYKALPVLLTDFVNTFDLGTVQDSASEVTNHLAMQMIGASTAPATLASTGTALETIRTVDPTRIGNNYDPLRRDPLRIDPSDPLGVHQPIPGRAYNQFEEPTLENAFGIRGPPGGDFRGDLLPGGGMPGNLMGPGHPMFGVGRPGGGMTPRFDPYGPPGGPTDPLQQQGNNGGRRRRAPPPGGNGVPNPGIARPPNDLSNNMFL